MRRFRVHVPGFSPGVGDHDLTAEESHHLIRVVRLAEGAEVDVFDGEGREWETLLTHPDPRRARVRVVRERTDPVEPSLHLELFQALCKFDRMDWVLQKGTELGVGAFHPVTTARAERLNITDARVERWRRIVREACKQSGRRRVPKVAPVAAAPSGPPPGGSGVVLVPDRASPALDRVLDRPAPSRSAILVGPEGGLTPEEVAATTAAGWLPAGLGPRILRTETAGVTAASIMLHRWADLGSTASG